VFKLLVGKGCLLNVAYSCFKISLECLIEGWHCLVHQVCLTSLDRWSSQGLLVGLERIELMHFQVLGRKLLELLSQFSLHLYLMFCIDHFFFQTPVLGLELFQGFLQEIPFELKLPNALLIKN
jgi:hypothetical protein